MPHPNRDAHPFISALFYSAVTQVSSAYVAITLPAKYLPFRGQDTSKYCSCLPFASRLEKLNYEQEKPRLADCRRHPLSPRGASGSKFTTIFLDPYCAVSRRICLGGRLDLTVPGSLWQKRRSPRAQRSFCSGSHRRGTGVAVLCPLRIESHYARLGRIFHGRRHYLHLRRVQDSRAQRMDFHAHQRHCHTRARPDGLRPLALRVRFDSGIIFWHQLTFARLFAVNARSFRVEVRRIISLGNYDPSPGRPPIELYPCCPAAFPPTTIKL
jgi:hypothetical protein